MPTYKIHPLAEIFPPLSDQRFQELVKDIGSEEGQHNPITLFEGKILDGVHRYKACLKLHMVPKVRVYTGNNPAAYVASENLKRRDLNESQRALIAAQLASHKNGRPGENRSPGSTVTNREAAAALEVSETSVDRAKSVLKHGSEKDVEDIKTGKTTVREVERKLKEVKAQKERITDHVGRVIPDDLIPEWKRAETVGKHLQSLARKIKSDVSEGFTGAKQDKVKDPIFAELTNSVISDAQALAWSLGSIIPFALCPTCQGKRRDSCALCRKRGWVSRFMWNSPVVSPETRAMIEGQNK